MFLPIIKSLTSIKNFQPRSNTIKKKKTVSHVKNSTLSQIFSTGLEYKTINITIIDHSLNLDKIFRLGVKEFSTEVETFQLGQKPNRNKPNVAFFIFFSSRLVSTEFFIEIESKTLIINSKTFISLFYI